MSDPNEKHRTRQWLLIGAAGTVLLALGGAGMFFFDPGQQKPKAKPTTVKISSPGSVSDKENWEAKSAAQMKTMEKDLGETKDALKRLLEEKKKQDDKLAELEKESEKNKADKAGGNDKARAGEAKGESILSDPLPKGKGGSVPDPRGPGQLASEKSGAADSNLNKPINAERPAKEIEIIHFNKKVAPTTKDAQQSASADQQGGKLEVLGFPVDEMAKKFAVTKGRGGEGVKQIEFIPAGSFIRLFMLNGVDAPAGGGPDTNSLPMTLHVVDPANLPNRYKLDVRDCRVVVNAWGDISSERTLGRAETMSCVLGDGQTVEMKVKGHLVGEDGKVGLRGRLVTKQGQLLANAALAGIAEGIGKAFNQNAQTISNNPLGSTSTIEPGKVGQAAFGSGVARSASALEQYYLRAADKLYPVIETDGGRVVELMITKGVVYTGTADVAENYRGLLKRAGANTRGSEDD